MSQQVRLTLDGILLHYYIERSAKTGKPMEELIVGDLEKYHESRRFAANEWERL